jgi:hypothetical protein
MWGRFFICRATVSLEPRANYDPGRFGTEWRSTEWRRVSRAALSLADEAPSTSHHEMIINIRSLEEIKKGSSLQSHGPAAKPRYAS